MAYRTPEDLFDEFSADWEAALCPSLCEFIEQCHPERRDDLIGTIDIYLEHAPTPPYSPVQQRRIGEKIKGRMGSRLDAAFNEGWKEFNEGPDGYAQQPALEKLRRRARFRWGVLRMRIFYGGIIGRMRTKPWD